MSECSFKVVVSLTNSLIGDRKKMRKNERKIMIEHDPSDRWALLYGSQDFVQAHVL
jgi:hypothetical protein